MWRFAFVTCASVTHAAVLEGVLDDLVVQFHDMPISVVEAAIANSLGKSLGIEGLPSSDVACVRDYGAACPEGWADQGDGETFGAYVLSRAVFRRREFCHVDARGKTSNSFGVRLSVSLC